VPAFVGGFEITAAGEGGHGLLKRGPSLEESRYGLGSKRISTAAGRGCGKVGYGEAAQRQF